MTRIATFNSRAKRKAFVAAHARAGASPQRADPAPPPRLAIPTAPAEPGR